MQYNQNMLPTPRYHLIQSKGGGCKIVAIAAIAMIFYPAFSEARNWYFEPAVSISAGYDDNPDLSSSVATGGLSTDAASAETTTADNLSQSYIEFGTNFLLESDAPNDTISATLVTESRRFEETVLDSDLIDTSLDYIRKLEKGEFSLGAAYLEESTSSANLATTDLGLIGTNLDRESFTLSAGSFRDFSTTLTGSVGLTHEEVGFSDSNPTPADVVPVAYDETTLDLSLTKTVTERLSVIPGLEFRTYRPTEALEAEEISKEEALTFSLGLSYNLRENIQLHASYAPTSIETSRVGESGTTTDDRSLYELSIEYSGFRNSFSAGVSRDLTASSLGGLRESDNFTLSWNRINTLGGTVSSSLTYGEQDQSGTSEIADGAQSFLDFETQYSKSFRRNLSWTLNYRYREQDFVSAQDAESNSVTVGLVYTWDRKLLPVGSN